MFFGIRILMIAVMVFSLNGCSEESNPLESGEQDHAEAMGLIVTSGADTLVIYREGNLDGSFSLNYGQLSPLYDVYFSDADNKYFRPDEPGYTFDWEIADSDVLEVEQETSVQWQFYLKPKEVGTTTIILKILHEGHADFVSLPVPVIIQ